MPKKKPQPPTDTIQPAVGPNTEGLTQQALNAQRRTEDKRRGDTDIEFAPDPADGERPGTLRTSTAKKATKARRLAATDEGTQAGSDS